MEIIKDNLSTSIGILSQSAWVSRVWSLKQKKKKICCNFPSQPCDKHQLFLLSKGAVSKRILLPLKAAYGRGAGIFLRMKHYLNITSMSRIWEASNYFPKASFDDPASPFRHGANFPKCTTMGGDHCCSFNDSTCVPLNEKQLASRELRVYGFFRSRNRPQIQSKFV